MASKRHRSHRRRGCRASSMLDADRRKSSKVRTANGWSWSPRLKLVQAAPLTARATEPEPVIRLFTVVGFRIGLLFPTLILLTHTRAHMVPRGVLTTALPRLIAALHVTDGQPDAKQKQNPGEDPAD